MATKTIRTLTVLLLAVTVMALMAVATPGLIRVSPRLPHLSFTANNASLLASNGFDARTQSGFLSFGLNFTPSHSRGSGCPRRMISSTASIEVGVFRRNETFDPSLSPLNVFCKGSRLGMDFDADILEVYSPPACFSSSKIQQYRHHTVHFQVTHQEYENLVKSVNEGSDDEVKTNLLHAIHTSGTFVTNGSNLELQVILSSQRQPRSSYLSTVFVILVAVSGFILFFFFRLRVVRLSTDHHLDRAELRIGEMTISQVKLGNGSDGTVVYKGTFGGRQVAVKRMVKEYSGRAKKEYENYISLGVNQNVLTCYGMKSDSNFLYIALEECTCTLLDLISPRDTMDAHMEFQNFIFLVDNRPSPQLLEILRDVVKGIAYLHWNGIIHRDIKPQNILLRKDKCWRAKVSDMGISKRLSKGKFALDNVPSGHGTMGWQAPEQIKEKPNQTTAVDMFNLGILIFYCVTGGDHPFVAKKSLSSVEDNSKKKKLSSSVEDNIKKGIADYSDKLNDMPEVSCLVSKLLRNNPKTRYTAEEVLHFPMFWDSYKRLSFLRDASDIVNDEDHSSTLSPLLTRIRSIPTHWSKQDKQVQPLNWDKQIDTMFLNSPKILKKRFKKYDYNSTEDLLRFMRNTINHYNDLDLQLQARISYAPGLDNYFLKVFPNFLLKVYWTMFYYCKTHSLMDNYFV